MHPLSSILPIKQISEPIPGWSLREIQRLSALIQRCFRPVSVLFTTWKSLKQRWFRAGQRSFPLKLAEQRWFLTDIFVFFSSFSRHSEVTPVRGADFTFSAQFAARSEQKKFTCLFSSGPMIQQRLKLRGFCYCSSSRTYIIQILKNFFPFSGMKFQNYFRKFDFCCHLAANWGNIYFATSTNRDSRSPSAQHAACQSKCNNLALAFQKHTIQNGWKRCCLKFELPRSTRNQQHD